MGAERLQVQIEGSIVCVGSIRFMDMEGIEIPPEIVAQQSESQAQGHSMVLVAVDHGIVGAIELQPTIRPEAKGIIHGLHERGIKTVIISGDHEAPTRQLATDLDIDRYFAEVLPEDKAKFVEQLQEEGHRVCFVGDGINDSIALKTADVSISLRGATTVATDMAQIVFMDGTLGQLPTLFTMADEFAENMNQNILVGVIPSIIGMAGTFLFGWGVTIPILILQGQYTTLRLLRAEAAVGSAQKSEKIIHITYENFYRCPENFCPTNRSADCYRCPEKF